MSVITFIGAMLVYFMWEAIAYRTAALVWIGAVAAHSLYCSVVAFGGCRYGGGTIQKRYRRFRFDAFTTALLWGIGIFAIYPAHDVVFQYFFVLIVVSMAEGGAISLSMDRRLATIYSSSMLVGLSVRLAADGDMLHISLAALVLLFLAIILLSVWRLGDTMVQALQEQERYAQMRSRYEYLVAQAPIGIMIFDTDFKLIDCNEKLAQIVGLDKEEILGLMLEDLKDKRPQKDIYRVLKYRETVVYDGPYRTTLTDREMWIHMIAAPLYDEEGRLIGVQILIQDETEAHKAKERADFLAYHDILTGLPNRLLLAERFKVQVAKAQRNGRLSAILFFDLDRFKQVNDIYGHGVGDEILKQVAARVGSVLRSQDTFCRLGGDEFILFLPSAGRDEKETKAAAGKVAGKIQALFQRPFEVAGRQLHLQVSIGVAIVKEGTTLEEALRQADIAMYEAKRKKGESVRFYTNEMDGALQRVNAMERALREALERGEFSLAYQPIVHLRTGRLVGAEALLRWHTLHLDAVSPEDFIPLAEETRLIVPIGYWVMEEVASQMAAWRREGLELEYVSVNLSSVQLEESDFFDEAMKRLRRLDGPGRLKFEVTENVLLQERVMVESLMHRFIEEGIGFLIDDFGTGYSSLYYLKNYPFEIIKIDRSFISDLLEDASDRTLVEAIVGIADQFGSHVVAEGVETEEQAKLLKSLGSIVYAQGYLYSQPLPAEDFAAWAKKFREKGA